MCFTPRSKARKYVSLAVKVSLWPHAVRHSHTVFKEGLSWRIKCENV